MSTIETQCEAHYPEAVSTCAHSFGTLTRTPLQTTDEGERTFAKARTTYRTVGQVVYVPEDTFRNLEKPPDQEADPLFRHGFVRDGKVILAIPQNSAGESSIEPTGITLSNKERDILVERYHLIAGRLNGQSEWHTMYKLAQHKSLGAEGVESLSHAKADTSVLLDAGCRMIELFNDGSISAHALLHAIAELNVLNTNLARSVLESFPKDCLALELWSAAYDQELALQYDPALAEERRNVAALRFEEARFNEARVNDLQFATCAEQRERFGYGADAQDELGKRSSIPIESLTERQRALPKPASSPRYLQSRWDGDIQIQFTGFSDLTMHIPLKDTYRQPWRFAVEVRFHTKTRDQNSEFPSYRYQLSHGSRKFEMADFPRVTEAELRHNYTDIASRPDVLLLTSEAGVPLELILRTKGNSSVSFTPASVGFFTDNENRLWVIDTGRRGRMRLAIHHPEREIDRALFEQTMSTGIHIPYIPKGFDVSRPPLKALVKSVKGKD